MGFRLESFFEELEQILNDESVGSRYKYQLLEEAILKAKQYAKDCGQIT